MYLSDCLFVTPSSQGRRITPTGKIANHSQLKICRVSENGLTGIISEQKGILLANLPPVKERYNIHKITIIHYSLQSPSNIQQACHPKLLNIMFRNEWIKLNLIVLKPISRTFCVRLLQCLSTAQTGLLLSASVSTTDVQVTFCLPVLAQTRKQSNNQTNRILAVSQCQQN